MKQTLFLIIALAPLCLTAQIDKPALLSAINKEIWQPFLDGVNQDKPALYNGVNSKDFNWVRGGNGKTRIMNEQEYREDARIVMEDRKKKGIQTELEVRFLERNLNESFAAEKCVIKFTSRQVGKAPEVAYAITQVFSRKENGVWKKLVQYVLPDPVTPTVFDNAARM